MWNYHFLHALLSAYVQLHFHVNRKSVRQGEYWGAQLKEYYRPAVRCYEKIYQWKDQIGEGRGDEKEEIFLDRGNKRNKCYQEYGRVVSQKVDETLFCANVWMSKVGMQILMSH